jgi:drug/metabolite transporter (DMT)-like permease
VHVPDPAKRKLAIFIVLACTLLTAIGQYLIKLGANRLSHAGLLGTMIGIFTIPQLFAGYCLYALFTVMFIYALRHGELSVLYPLISLSYVWVAITAVVAFHETMNPLKIAGLLVIMCGVGVLGWGGGSSMVLVLVGSVIGSVGAIFLKSGAHAVNRHWTSIAFNWRLGMGIATYMASSVLFVKGMSNGELSVLFPLVSLGYVCTLVWSRLFFNEVITKVKLAGVGLILVGIAFLSMGSR